MIMKASHRAVMVCSECLLFKKKKLFELFFELFGGPPNKSIHVINYTLQGVMGNSTENVHFQKIIKITITWQIYMCYHDKISIK